MNNQILDEGYGASTPTLMPRFASFWIRAVASILDSLILIPLIFISFYNMISYKVLLFELLITFIHVFYKVFLEYKYQATLGKKIMKIKVVNQSGGYITLEQSIVRFAFYFLSYGGAFIANYYLWQMPGFEEIVNYSMLITMQTEVADNLTQWTTFPLLLSCSFVLFDLRKQAIHDKMANTFVIEDRPLPTAPPPVI